MISKTLDFMDRYIGHLAKTKVTEPVVSESAPPEIKKSKFKTLDILEHYSSVLNEQPEDPAAQQPDPSQQTADAAPDAQQQPEGQEPPQEPEDPGPSTSEGENEYISTVIDAALFKPSTQERKTLLNLQNVMSSKRYRNARQEILPILLMMVKGPEYYDNYFQNQTEPGQDTAPLTPQLETEYISDMIDAALFKPTPDEAKTLSSLRDVMRLKRFTNARDEVLGKVLPFIHTQTDEKELKDDLSSVD